MSSAVIDDILSKFEIADGVYLLGCLERGVTIYKQQVRAHNLVWSLWENDRFLPATEKIRSVAIVGGGIAGLTTAACFLARFNEEVKVTLFERLSDLCPMQQGSDTRWVHPRIYSWPEMESRSPSANLPVLGWSEGRASDVARIILKLFGTYCEKFDFGKVRFRAIVGIDSIYLTTRSKTIECVGNLSKRIESFFKYDKEWRETSTFDVVILATGFDVEKTSTKSKSLHSYWRNETFGQPLLDGTERIFMVSGYGDGALIDICRLTIERFRQDTIVYELFGDQLEDVEKSLRNLLENKGDKTYYEIFSSLDDSFILNSLSKLQQRVRKDTKVVWQAGGRVGRENQFSKILQYSTRVLYKLKIQCDPKGKWQTSVNNNDKVLLSKILEHPSSILNKLLGYLLLRCNAIVLTPESIDKSMLKFNIGAANIIRRHGSDPLVELKRCLVDYHGVSSRLAEIQRISQQHEYPRWRPGTFPHIAI